MRERARDAERLKHILDAINGIQMSKDRYGLEAIERNSIIFYGFVKYLEIIGEAVYMLTKEFRNDHPEVEWDVIEKMRHVLVHDYYQIQAEQLWETIENDLPDLKPMIDRFYDEEINNNGGVLKDPDWPYGGIWTADEWKKSSIWDIARSLDIEYEDD